MTSRNISESVKKRVAGKQYYKCANDPKSDTRGLENYECPLWAKKGDNKGCFDESGYDIDHIKEYSKTKNNSEKNLQALCKSCHSVKTKRFLNKKTYSDESDTQDIIVSGSEEEALNDSKLDTEDSIESDHNGEDPVLSDSELDISLEDEIENFLDKNIKFKKIKAKRSAKKNPYQEFMLKEIKRQKDLEPGLPNTEYLSRAATNWVKYKKNHNITTINSKGLSYKTMHMIKKKPTKMELNKREQIKQNTINFLNELSCAQLKYICKMVGCISKGTKKKMIECIEYFITVSLVKIKDHIVNCSTFKYIKCEISNIFEYTNNKKYICKECDGNYICENPFYKMDEELIDINPIDKLIIEYDIEFKKIRNNFSVKQLKQLQDMFNIYKSNTKRKDDLINNIIDNNISIDDIMKKIKKIEDKRYVYMCMNNKNDKECVHFVNKIMKKCPKHSNKVCTFYATKQDNEFYDYSFYYYHYNKFILNYVM